MPDWFRLLQYHRRERLGLTFPFLLGATRTPPGAELESEYENFHQLERLLRSMRDDTPEGHYVRIMTCNNLEQPVATPGLSKYRFEGVDIQIPTGSGKCVLYVEPTYVPNPARGEDSVLETLWKHTRAPVLERRFSYRQGAYTPFNDVDLAFIDRALSDHDEDELI